MHHDVGGDATHLDLALTAETGAVRFMHPIPQCAPEIWKQISYQAHLRLAQKFVLPALVGPGKTGLVESMVESKATGPCLP